MSSGNGCQLNECGYTPNGLLVRAITDSMGAQVVVTNDLKPEDDSLLSKPLESHQAAISLGEMVVKHGTSIYSEWRGPVSTLVEFASIMATSQRYRGDCDERGA